MTMSAKNKIKSILILSHPIIRYNLQIKFKVKYNHYTKMEHVLDDHVITNSIEINGDIENTTIDGKSLHEPKENDEGTYHKLKYSISVRDFLSESLSYQDIELRSSKSCEQTVRANRIVLAAVSPFFKQCLADVEEGQITITDCCHESLTHVMHYIHNGCVTITNEVMKEKVHNLISRLQIGDFSIRHLSKLEPREDSNFDPVKSEVGWGTEENAVDNYYNYINRISKLNESQALKRKKRADNEWKSQVINSLYKEDVEAEEADEDEDFVEEDDHYYSDDDDDDDEEYEKPKSKPKSSGSTKKYGCKSCGSKFSSQEKLASHTQRKHSSQKFKCEHCPKTFSRASDKRVHEEVHSKPYKCEECDASFGRKSNLIGHLR